MGMLRRYIKNGASFADSLSSLQSLKKDWGASIVGAPTLVASRFGPVITFDGITDEIQALDSEAWNFGTGDFSIVFWVRTSQAAWSRVLTRRTGATWYSVALGLAGGAGHVSLQTSGAANTGSISAVNDGIWYHVVITKSGTAVSYYVDGIADGTDTAVADVDGGSAALSIGALVGGRPLAGSLHDVWMIGRVLSAQEALDLAQHKTFDY